ncbi:MAG TPA: ABC transporter permease [Actinocrinis sp.]|nr:ABC transporter permease [Actinocrinis sp.]
MSATTLTTTPATPTAALRRLTVSELRLFFRDRSGPIVGIGFPIALLVIFGEIPYYSRPKPDLGGLTLLDVYVPILITFVISMLSTNILPPALAGYREKGVLRRLKTTPAGPARVLAAQLAVSLAVEAFTVLVLLLVARFAFHVAMPRQPAGFLLSALLAAVALIAVGLFVAAAAPTAKIANAMGAILFYVMMFFAGLFLPTENMPSTLQHISHATPLGAAVQALNDSAQGHWPHPLQLFTMAAYAVAFGLAAVRLFRWE